MAACSQFCTEKGIYEADSQAYFQNPQGMLSLKRLEMISTLNIIMYCNTQNGFEILGIIVMKCKLYHIREY